MREHIVAMAAATARPDARALLENGGTQRDVALEAMRGALGCWMGPDEDEAFTAAVVVLWELYPDDAALRQETTAIGERTRVLGAIVAGVPVALDEVVLTPMPDPALGLVALFEEARRDG